MLHRKYHESTVMSRTLFLLGKMKVGGEGGIRTHGRISPTHAFQACALNRSDTSPHARRATNLINLAESSRLRTDGHPHCPRTPSPRAPNRKLSCDFFRRTSPPRT